MVLFCIPVVNADGSVIAVSNRQENIGSVDTAGKSVCFRKRLGQYVVQQNEFPVLRRCKPPIMHL